jgi:tRNA(Ile)-lysidine synthase
MTHKSQITNRKSQISLVRPLLEVTHKETVTYCREHGLEPRFDRSNLDATRFRNRLRHDLLPYLETFNPRIRDVLRHTAQALTDDYEALREQIELAWATIAQEELDLVTFDLAAWLALSPSLQRGLLREGIRRLRRDLRNIDWVHVEEARRIVKSKPTGAEATLPRGLRLYRDYDRLILGQALPSDAPQLAVDSLPLAVPSTTPLPDSLWRLEAAVPPRSEVLAEELEGTDRWLTIVDFDRVGSELALRRRQAGDRFRPLGMSHEKLLRDFFIDEKVPRAWRARWPLVVSPRGIVWVAGYRIDDRFKVTARTERVLRLRFARRS